MLCSRRFAVLMSVGFTLLLSGLAQGAPKAAPHELAVQAAQAPAPTAPGDTVVYITRTGAKYHRDGCRSLAKSRIPIKLREAVDRGYGPCKICKPPVLATAAAAAPTTTAAAMTAPKAQASTVPGRCQAITKKGTQCTRRAMPGSIYCWQHAR